MEAIMHIFLTVLPLFISYFLMNQVYTMKMDTKDAQLYYLVKYGHYVDTDNPENYTSAFKSAMIRFQQMFGLKQTGYGDPDTVQLMQHPRCGLPDFMFDRNNSSRVKRYVIGSRSFRYKQMPLTYRIVGYSPDLDKLLQDSSFEEGFSRWVNVTNVSFRKTEADADIRISFGSYRHENCDYSFDGESGVLAHTFLPNFENGSVIHLDEDENWSGSNGSFLTKIFTHEVGHALGLAHSENMDSLMNPFPLYDGPNWSLQQDDIEAITKIYGKKGEPFMKGYS